MNLIAYEPSFFQQVLSNRVYRAKNSGVLNACLEEIEEPMQPVTAEENANKPFILTLIPTHVQAMTYLLNRLNSILLFLHMKGIKEVLNAEGDLIAAHQLDFLKNHIRYKEGFEAELDRFHRLFCHFKNKLLVPGTSSFNEITTMVGDKKPITSSNLFVKNLNHFFPHPIDVEGTNDSITFTYRGDTVSVEVREATKAELSGEYYKIYGVVGDVDDSRDYYSFNLPNNYVYVFENNPMKIRNLKDNPALERTSDKDLSLLFHRDLLVDYKKVF